MPRRDWWSIRDMWVHRGAREQGCKGAYEAAFVSKLNDSEAEAAETQTRLAFAADCGYLSTDTASELRHAYDQIIGKLVNMISHPDPWILKRGIG
jgi:four helix bundle protein